MRLQKFRDYLAAEGLAGFLVTRPENRRYLSGFTGSAGVLIVTPDRQALATDSRYYEQVRQESPEWELVEAGYKLAEKLPDLLGELGLAGQRVGFEAGHISVATLADWQDTLLDRVELAPVRNAVEELRVFKDEAEIASLRQAIALADAALVHIMDWIKPGQTEQQVAWELESMMRTRGASAVSFEPIVASGPNSARPHARPTDRRIQPGEPITLDFGCIVNGYCSDLTRSFCLGEPADERYLAVWNTVLAAQEAALNGARAGQTGAEIDGLARQVINQAGYGDYFGHSLGHGLGLAVHEEPRFSLANSGLIPAGAVATVEPGIYIPGWGGVRIEDVVVVGQDGLEVLSTAPKEAVLA